MQNAAEEQVLSQNLGQNAGAQANAPEIEALFQAGAHLGYGKTRRHPKMREYIFGTRNNVEIFDLERTLAKLTEAESFMRALGEAGKLVLWVGTKSAAARHIEAIGTKLGHPYVSLRWLGGTITNFKIIGDRLSSRARTRVRQLCF